MQPNYQERNLVRLVLGSQGDETYKLHAEYGDLDDVEIQVTSEILGTNDPIAGGRGHRQDSPEDDGNNRPIAGQRH